MMHAKVLALALISTSVAAALPALGDEKGFGHEGQLTLSADRLFGLSFTSTKNEDGSGAGTATSSDTSITMGPILDVPLTGTSSSETTPNPGGTNPPDDKVKFLNYGLTLGLLGYF